LLFFEEEFAKKFQEKLMEISWLVLPKKGARRPRYFPKRVFSKKRAKNQRNPSIPAQSRKGGLKVTSH
jgi:hypothetical protein